MLYFTFMEFTKNELELWDRQLDKLSSKKGYKSSTTKALIASSKYKLRVMLNSVKTSTAREISNCPSCGSEVNENEIIDGMCLNCQQSYLNGE